MTQWGLDTLFNPAKRHMDEEKRRLQATRQQVGDTSGGKRIDLESGKVKIRRPAGEAEPEAEQGEASSEEDGETERSSKPEPTPAAIRAARRRGRQPR